MTMKAFLSSTYSKMIFVGGMNIILQERLLRLLILLLDVDHEDGPHIWLGDFLRVDQFLEGRQLVFFLGRVTRSSGYFAWAFIDQI